MSKVVLRHVGIYMYIAMHEAARLRTYKQLRIIGQLTIACPGG